MSHPVHIVLAATATLLLPRECVKTPSVSAQSHAKWRTVNTSLWFNRLFFPLFIFNPLFQGDFSFIYDTCVFFKIPVLTFKFSRLQFSLVLSSNVSMTTQHTMKQSICPQFFFGVRTLSALFPHLKISELQSFIREFWRSAVLLHFFFKCQNNHHLKEKLGARTYPHFTQIFIARTAPAPLNKVRKP